MILQLRLSYNDANSESTAVQGIYHTDFMKSSNTILALYANPPNSEGSLGYSERIILEGPQVISEQGQESWTKGRIPFSRNGVCSP